MRNIPDRFQFQIRRRSWCQWNLQGAAETYRGSTWRLQIDPARTGPALAQMVADTRTKARANRRACTFKQGDVTRAIKAAKAAGLRVTGVDSATGCITVGGNPRSDMVSEDVLDAQLAAFVKRHEN